MTRVPAWQLEIFNLSSSIPFAHLLFVPSSIPFSPLLSSPPCPFFVSNTLPPQVKPEWISGLDKTTMLTSKVYDVKVNKWGAKCGGSLGMWESSGWISDADPYGERPRNRGVWGGGGFVLPRSAWGF